VVIAATGLLAVRPAHAADDATINTSANAGVMGGQLASPPGSCTAAPGGALGDCNDRGSASVDATTGGTFFDDTSWSDLREADIPLTENGNTEVGLVMPDGTIVAAGSNGEPATDMGSSWMPFTNCFGPYCGHLTRGDVAQYDENGDGVFDDTWDDTVFCPGDPRCNNGVIDNGEIDRTRAEQFSWGVTSLVRDVTDLGSLFVQGNAFPAGMARERVRFTLGDAALAGDCDGRVDNPACIDGVISSDAAAGVFVDDNGDPLGNERDAQYWGECDPDRFNPGSATLQDASITTLAEGQRALDNCLWWHTALPILPTGINVDNALDANAAGDPFYLDDGHLFDQRTIWLDQAVRKDTFASVPDAQEYAQTLYVAYGFEKIEALDEARYENIWEIRQQDYDPNLDLNGTTNPNFPFTFTAASDGLNRDTYPYAFAVNHRSLARARGEDNGTDANPFDAHLVTECTDGMGNDSDCDHKTNPTVDPFWSAQWTGGSEPQWNQQFEYIEGEPCLEGCQDSGVGRERGLVFLTAQDVNGYFEQCVNCAPDGVEPFPLLTPQPTYMPYESAWNVVPTVFHAF
jgi:hypothetical protein